jgi:CHAT domain-containing protein
LATDTAALPAAPEQESALRVGEAIYLRGQFDSASTLWRAALVRAKANHDSLAEARLLTWLGLADYRRGDYASARRQGEQALQIKLRAAFQAELARSYNALGLLAWNEGRLSDAIVMFGSASRSARAQADEAGLAKAANNLALVYTEMGEFAPARLGFIEARRAGHRLSDARIEGGALTNLGMLDIQLGDPRSALTSLERARALYASIGYETGEQNALGQLGTAYDALGEPRLAFAALDSALALSRKEGLRQEEASDLELIAGLYRQGGDLRHALELYQQANRLNGELGLAVEEGTGLRNEAEIYAALGRSDVAKDRTEQALAIHTAAGARLQQLRDHLLLAELTAAGPDDAASAEHLRAADRVASALDARVARVEVALTRAQIRERVGDAEGVIRTLSTADRDLDGDYRSEWRAQLLRARAFEQRAMLDSAADAGRHALMYVERIRSHFGSAWLRSSYAVDKSGTYADLTAVLLRLDRSAEAFEVADASRSRALLEYLGAPNPDVPLRGDAIRTLAGAEVLLRQIDTLTSRLDALEATPPPERDATVQSQAVDIAARLATARGAYEALLVRVGERDADGARLLGSRPVTADVVRRVLSQGEAVLEYFVMPDRVVVFVVTPAGVRTVTSQIALEDLTRRVRLARDLLGHPGGTREAAAVLTALHAALIAPAERAGALEGIDRLIMIPHSVLAYLPFAALTSEATGHYLVQDYALLHAPSAAAFAVLRGEAAETVRTAQPELRGTAFAPFTRKLPATLRELRAVRRSLAGATLYQGTSATEARLRSALEGGGPVHVASHAVMNPRRPMFSRIELARGDGGSTDDGRLEVHELLELRIHAPLVFLSGCETGVGAAWSTEFVRGDDYATLAQAFLYAGARSVMATLWRIGDAGAAALTERFYAGLDHQAVPEALAAAQQALIGHPRYGDPYYWAAFQVTGDGRAIREAHRHDITSVQRRN